MIARAVKDLETEARMTGRLRRNGSPGGVGLAEALEMHELIVVHDAVSQTRDVHLAHLLLDVGVDGGEVGVGGG